MADEFDEALEVAADDVTDVVEPAQDGGDAGAEHGQDHEGLPALARPRSLDRPAAVPPAAQTAAVVATGFVAGAAAAVLVRRRSARRVARSRTDALVGSRRRAERLSIVSTRTYLVQVHVLGRPTD